MPGLKQNKNLGLLRYRKYSIGKIKFLHKKNLFTFVEFSTIYKQINALWFKKKENWSLISFYF